jgi:hypothetical protein
MLTFKIFKETAPRLGIPNVMADSLPWVYDQDPSSGFSASLRVVPEVDVARLTKQRDELVAALERFVSYGNVFAHKAWEGSPYDQAKAALAAVKEPK